MRKEDFIWRIYRLLVPGSCLTSVCTPSGTTTHHGDVCLCACIPTCAGVCSCTCLCCKPKQCPSTSLSGCKHSRYRGPVPPTRRMISSTLTRRLLSQGNRIGRCHIYHEWNVCSVTTMSPSAACRCSLLWIGDLWMLQLQFWLKLNHENELDWS